MAQDPLAVAAKILYSTNYTSHVFRLVKQYMDTFLLNESLFANNAIQCFADFITWPLLNNMLHEKHEKSSHFTPWYWLWLLLDTYIDIHQMYNMHVLHYDCLYYNDSQFPPVDKYIK